MNRSFALYWSLIGLAALLGGWVLGKGSILLDVLLFTLFLGIVLISLPLEWLFSGLLVASFVIAPCLEYFGRVLQATYIPPALAMVVGVKLFLNAVLDRKRRRSSTKRPRGTSAIPWAVGFYLFAIVVSAAINRLPVQQTLLALKVYLPFWSCFFAISLGFVTRDFVVRVWRWLVPLALLQLPFTLYQHFFIAPSRKDAGTAMAADCVVGTFGGDPMAGGNSATLMLMLIAGMIVAFALFRGGRIGRAHMLIALTVCFAALLLGETKAAFVFLPLAFIVFDLRQILSNPTRLLGVILVGGPLLFGMFQAYKMMYWTEQGASSSQSNDSAIAEQQSSYLFDPNGYNMTNGDVGRGAALAIWWTDPQADFHRRAIGYGPLASKTSSNVASDGVIAKRYRPLGVGAHTVAVLLWEIGLIGTIAFAAVLISAFTVGVRRLPLFDKSEDRQILGAATAIVAIMIIVMFYNTSLVIDGASALLMMLCLGTIQTFSAHLHPERKQRIDSREPHSARSAGRTPSYPAVNRASPNREGSTNRGIASRHGITPSRPAQTLAQSETNRERSSPTGKAGSMVHHAFWAALSTWGSRAMTLLVFALLTRLLTSEAIGLLAFIGVIHAHVLLLASSFSDYLMFKRDASSSAESTIFWFQLLLAIGVASLFGVAGYVWGESWIHHPDAPWIIVTLAASIPLPAAASIPDVLLRRRFAFKQVAFRSMLATVLGGIVGVTMAFHGWGVWSLVWKAVIEGTTISIFCFAAARWLPRATFRRRDLIPALRYGFGAMANATVQSLNARIDSLVIGMTMGAGVLGYYTVGQRVSSMLWELLNGVVRSVAVPHLAATTHDRPALTALHRKLVRTTTLICAPAFAALGALAPQLVPLAFGSQWQESSALLQMFCIGGLLTGMAVYSDDILMVSGRVGSAVQLNIAQLLATGGLVYLGSRFGVLYAALGTSLAVLITLPLGLRLARKVSDFRLRDIPSTVAPGILTAAVLYATIATTDALVSVDSRIMRLSITSAAGAVSLVLAWGIFAPQFLQALIHQARDRLPRRRTA